MTKSTIAIRSKLPNVKKTIFATMSQKARAHGAINLSQGFPDFDCSPKLIELVHHYMQQGMNQYAPLEGIPALRERLSEKVNDLYNVRYDPDTEINITAGATQAIYTAITTVVKPGDEVIIFEPAYDCYVPAIQLNGGQPVYIEMEPPHYQIDWEEVNRRLTDRTKMIIINTPHNPTGTTLNKSDLKALEACVSGTDIVVLSDEVYEHIIFDGHTHQSVMRYPNLAERSFAVFSFGKVFHTTGWKIGYCLAPQALMNEFRKVHQFEVFCTNRPLQHALADFLQDKAEYMQLSDLYQKKRDYFLELIGDSRFECVPAGGTYFQLLNYHNISSEADTTFSDHLIEDIGVASIPLSPFYHKGNNRYAPNSRKTMLRFCFAKEDQTLEKAAKILCKI